jgi:predicted site-specific integrase-resolvase
MEVTTVVKYLYKVVQYYIKSLDINIQTFGNHRRYKLEDIEAIINSTEIEQKIQRNVFIYCRVSTNKQKERGENSENNNESNSSECNRK